MSFRTKQSRVNQMKKPWKKKQQQQNYNQRYGRCCDAIEEAQVRLIFEAIVAVFPEYFSEPMSPVD